MLNLGRLELSLTDGVVRESSKLNFMEFEFGEFMMSVRRKYVPK